MSRTQTRKGHSVCVRVWLDPELAGWAGVGGGTSAGSQKGRNVLKFAHLVDDFGFSVAGDLEGGETRRRGTH